MEICNYNNNRLNINEYEQSTHKGNITCPCCETPVIAKQGEFKQHHFAHKSLIGCDSWYAMSEWHSAWQNQFSKDFREVVCISNGEKHRADIKINHLIVEFQNSNISNWDFCERNDFYTANGDLLVWLFNLDNGHVFSTLNLVKPSDRILCFTESEGIISCPLNNKYTKEEFINLLRYFYKQNNFNFVYDELQRLKDEEERLNKKRIKELEIELEKEERLQYNRDRFCYEISNVYDKSLWLLYRKSWIIDDEIRHQENLKKDSEYKNKWQIEEHYLKYKKFRLQKIDEEKKEIYKKVKEESKKIRAEGKKTGDKEECLKKLSQQQDIIKQLYHNNKNKNYNNFINNQNQIKKRNNIK